MYRSDFLAQEESSNIEIETEMHVCGGLSSKNNGKSYRGVRNLNLSVKKFSCLNLVLSRD